MNSRAFRLIALSVVLTMSCQKELSTCLADSQAPETETQSNLSTSYPATKSDNTISFEAQDYKFEMNDLNTSYFVDENDITSYLKYVSLVDEKREVRNIEPFSINDETLFYVINYINGWDVVAADKRVPHVLGHSDNGTMTMKGFENDARKTWLFTLAVDVLNVRLSETDTASLEENDDYRFWVAITNPEQIIASTGTPPPPPHPGYPGHYELSDVSIYHENISVPHLLSTAWHQNNNQFVPPANDGSGRYCPSGCVAVAGAQVLKYLHDQLGVPQYAPAIANLTAIAMGQAGTSSYVWNYMQNNGNDTYSKIWMAHVGYLANTVYSPQGSGAYVSNLVDNVIIPYGISCNYHHPTADNINDGYNVQAVFSEIYSRHMPILMEAQAPITINDITVDYVGHCFVMDGCQFHKKTTSYRYEWVYDVVNPTTPLPSPLPERIDYVIETSNLLVQMNWGDGDANNNELYSPTGDWIRAMDGNSYNFNRNRNMVSEFAVN